ncbi:MAG TPA: LysM domain-containing protein [Gammaproteobacteria bacterium]
MNHYTFPCLAAAAILGLLAGCAHHAVKPAPVAAAPAPATVAAPATATVAPNTAPAMQPTAPQRYTVKKGDTLWGIAGMYLKNPWDWPEIWYDNPAIKNPHLIFPGDVLILGHNAQGQPTLSVERSGTPVMETPAPGTAAAAVTATPAATAAAPVHAVANTAGLPVTKLEPQPRYLPLDAAVTTVPLNGLLPYLSKTRIVGSSELDNTGYLITSFNQAPATGAGEEVYARDMKPADGNRYEILRKGDKYVDPDSGDTLGYEATYIGDATVETWTDPAKLLITNSAQEAVPGDRFVPTNGDPVKLNFFPHHPAKTVDGQIAAVLGGVGQIGQYDVLVLNRGSDDGVDAGTVLGVYRRGDKVQDLHAGFFSNSSVRLPTERSGTVMVFRTFKKASYALVMQATHEIHLADYVGNP